MSALASRYQTINNCFPNDGSAKHRGYTQCVRDALFYLKTEKLNEEVINRLHDYLLKKCKFVDPRTMQSKRKCFPNSVKEEQVGCKERNIPNSYSTFQNRSTLSPLIKEIQTFPVLTSERNPMQFLYPETSTSTRSYHQLDELIPGTYCPDPFRNLFSNLLASDLQTSFECRDVVQSNPNLVLSSSNRCSSSGFQQHFRQCNSNDSGNWSSGSRPASPDDRTETFKYRKSVKKIDSFCKKIEVDHRREIKESSLLLGGEVWRPWEK